MTQRITRRDMKRNELAETVGKTVGYVSEHKKGVAESVAIAVGVVLVVAAFFAYRAWADRSAGRNLSDALAILSTPLVTEQPSATKTYPNAAARQAEADPLLRKAASRGSTPSGRAAQVILAAAGSQKPGEAVQAFENAARKGRSEAAAAAEIDAAKMLAAEGKSTEAIERLKRAIEAPTTSAPKDALLFTLAQIYESNGAAADARATYQRLMTDYPNSPYRADARQKVPLS
jgi:predicted negative regulator of RcsB-dependent stress response